MAGKRLALTIICALVPLAAAAPAGATFPGRNGRIAYPNASGIATVRPDGGDVRQLVELAGARDPAWSPDGTQLAFAAPNRKHLQVYVVSASGGDLRRVTRGGADRWRPSWAPHAHRLAVLGDAPPVDGRDRAAVLVVQLANRRERQVATAGADTNFGDAEWAPDGSAIAFTDTDIFLVSPKGGSATQVTHEPVDTDEELPNGMTRHTYGHVVDDLSWAPHAARLAFSDLVSCPCDDEFNVATIRRDGSGRHDILSSDTQREPAWAPDGTAIDFCDYQPYVTQPSLWTMTPVGGGQRQVQDGAGCGGGWQALPRTGH